MTSCFPRWRYRLSAILFKATALSVRQIRRPLKDLTIRRRARACIDGYQLITERRLTADPARRAREIRKADSGQVSQGHRVIGADWKYQPKCTSEEVL